MVYFSQDKGKENKTMTRTEIENKIKEIEHNRFLLAMKDHWNRDDFDWDSKAYSEVKKLIKPLLSMNSSEEIESELNKLNNKLGLL